MIGKRMKQARRYQEMIRAFLRNGFGFIMKDLGLLDGFSLCINKGEKTSEENQRNLGERIRTLFEELGTTFIKLGQIASTRRDIFPVDITSELEKLQNNVPPVSFQEAKKLIEEQFGDQLDTFFAEFHDNPIASASIGQVYKATLHSGEIVAVKVQRPNIEKIIETDLEILDDLARLMDARFEWARTYHIKQFIDEFANSLRKELNFTIEGKNAEKIAKQFENDPQIHIPKIYWDFTTKKVLTMDFIEGIKVDDIEQIAKHNFDRKHLAKKLIDCFLHQILNEGFFHGDPHPGNLMILKDGSIALLDFGIVGQISDELKYQFVQLLVSLEQGNTNKIVKTLLQMGLFSDDDVNLSMLRSDVEKMREKYYKMPLNEYHLKEVFIDFFEITSKYHIQIPKEFSILGKTIVTLEGIIERLDPEINIMSIAEPFAKNLVIRQFHPFQMIRNAWQEIKEISERIYELPKELDEFSTTVKKGKLHFEISVPELQTFLEKLEKMSNRIAFSVILLSFSIVMVGLIIGSSIGRESTILWKFPIIEIGAVVASLMFLWLLFSIFRSGKL